MNAITSAPVYVCHKRVQALQIKAVTDLATGSVSVEFTDEAFKSYIADSSMIVRYKPVPGDYFVLYPDGYKSFSPKQAFEEGYTLMNANIQVEGV